MLDALVLCLCLKVLAQTFIHERDGWSQATSLAKKHATLLCGDQYTAWLNHIHAAADAQSTAELTCRSGCLSNLQQQQ